MNINQQLKQLISAQDEEMNSDDEEEELDSHAFSLKIVNAYGNSQLPDPVVDDNGVINLRANQHLGLDWRPKAKDLFFKVSGTGIFRPRKSFSLNYNFFRLLNSLFFSFLQLHCSYMIF